MFTARIFWRRGRVLKSGTVQSSPTSLNKLSTKPAVCLSAIQKSTFIIKHVGTAAPL
jgi:hypothetical protein